MTSNTVENIGRYFTAFVNQNHAKLLEQHQLHITSCKETEEVPLTFPIYSYMMFHHMSARILSQEIHKDLTMLDIHEMTTIE